MKKEYEYLCPDCKEKVEFGDNFCKNCSCKLNWEEEQKENAKEEHEITEKNNKHNKEKKNNIYIGLAFILIQNICYLTSFSTGNIPTPKDGFASQLGQFIGSNLFLIIGIIYIIKNKSHIKTIYTDKFNLILFIINIILFSIFLIYSY